MTKDEAEQHVVVYDCDDEGPKMPMPTKAEEVTNL